MRSVPILWLWSLAPLGAWAADPPVETGAVAASPSGHLATIEVVQGGDGEEATVRVVTLDVDAGAWNHRPATGRGPTVAAARRAAWADLAPTHALSQPQDRVAATAVGVLREGSRDHAHVAGPHRVPVTLQGVAGGPWVLEEVPTGADCGQGVVAVAPHLRRADGTDLLAARHPRRWPRCAVAFDVDRAWTGPGGAVLVRIRSLTLQDGDVVVTMLYAAGRAGSG